MVWRIQFKAWTYMDVENLSQMRKKITLTTILRKVCWMAYNNNLDINLQQMLLKVENNVKHFCTFARHKAMRQKVGARSRFYYIISIRLLLFCCFISWCCACMYSFATFSGLFCMPTSQRWCMHFMCTTRDKYFLNYLTKTTILVRKRVHMKIK